MDNSKHGYVGIGKNKQEILKMYLFGQRDFMIGTRVTVSLTACMGPV